MASAEGPAVVCLEFFSGIGGLHHGLMGSGVDGRVAMAWDMNENANAVYQGSFGQRPSNKAIDHLTAADIDRFGASCWLLSPPCQPYTRGGNYGDADDPRARGLLRLVDLLARVGSRPTHVFVENVLNFENSRSRALLVAALLALGFEVQEWLLSPRQMGIPNNRQRYYLAARLRWPEPQPAATASAHAAWAAANSARAQAYLARGRAVLRAEWPFGPAPGTAAGRPLASYIDPACDADPALQVPAADILKRKRLGLDIVQRTSAGTATFTKAYGSRHLIGSGSLLQTRSTDTDGMAAQTPEELLALGLRFFSPDEVARLHHFPTAAADAAPRLLFPPHLSLRQRLQLLGNSLNVHVVAQLLRHVLFAADPWERMAE